MLPAFFDQRNVDPQTLIGCDPIREDDRAVLAAPEGDEQLVPHRLRNVQRSPNGTGWCPDLEVRVTVAHGVGDRRAVALHKLCVANDAGRSRHEGSGVNEIPRQLIGIQSLLVEPHAPVPIDRLRNGRLAFVEGVEHDRPARGLAVVLPKLREKLGCFDGGDDLQRKALIVDRVARRASDRLEAFRRDHQIGGREFWLSGMHH